MTVATEQHYRVKELAAIWKVSAATITRLFAREPGVLRLTGDRGKRRYVVMSIPASVAARVHERMGLGSEPARREPLRVVRPLHARTKVA
jgi:hypothetical protein